MTSEAKFPSEPDAATQAGNDEFRRRKKRLNILLIVVGGLLLLYLIFALVSLIASSYSPYHENRILGKTPEQVTEKYGKCDFLYEYEYGDGWEWIPDGKISKDRTLCMMYNVKPGIFDDDHVVLIYFENGVATVVRKYTSAERFVSNYVDRICVVSHEWQSMKGGL